MTQTLSNKKIGIISILGICFFVGSFTTSNAIVCSNCANVVQGWAIQIKDTLTAANTNISAVSQKLVEVNELVTKPLNDAMTLINIAKSGDLVKNLVLGGLDGETRLLIENPKEYLENEGREQLKLNLAQIEETRGIYSESILKNAIDEAKRSSDVGGVLQSLSHSSIPSIVQNNLCLDETLSDKAKNDVMLSDGTYDESDYRRRKNELYNTLCTGDPNTDPALAETLVAVNEADPTIGGWDTWLSVTGGDNLYTNGVLAQETLKRERAKKEEEKAKDLEQGKGIASKTECVEWKVSDYDGAKYCLRENITNLGDQLNKSYAEAINAPLKILLSSYGSGAIPGILGNVITIMGSVNTLEGVFSAGGAGYTSSGNTSSVVKETPLNDLTNNADKKSQLSTPPLQQLNQHLESLNTLSTIDNQYLSLVNSYQLQIGNVKACYDRLVFDYPALTSDSRIISANSIYTNKKSSTDTLKSSISSELSKISTTKTLITSTINAISTSNSSEEIFILFTDYQNTVDSQNLPTQTTGLSREGEMEQFKFDSAAEFSASEAGAGQMLQLQTTCDQIRQQMATGGVYVPPSTGGL